MSSLKFSAEGSGFSASDSEYRVPDSGVRVRFAPSPSGYLHIGGARTALYNWLFARKNKGSFILRIEDTDQTRSTDEAIEAIIDSLEWLGLSWDEGPKIGGEFGPYRQTERFGLYREAAEKLLRAKKSYYCYCLPEELKERREELLKKGRPPRYDRHCLGLSPEEEERFKKEGRKPAVRFRTSDVGVTRVSDLIRGEVTFDNSTLGDFIILRSDGTPTYNLAATVDDYMMRITHVIRGDDHLPNTPKQILLYQDLGWEIPQFAHLPMIVGRDRAPLSKRHGAVSVAVFRKEGYLPETFLNFLALLGWSYDEAQVLFEKDELIQKFSLERVIKSAALFDTEKLDWMNGNYIRQMSAEELPSKIIPFLVDEGLIEGPEIFPDKWWQKLAEIIQERIKTLKEAVSLTDFFFKEELVLDEKAEKVLGKEGAKEILRRVFERLSELEDFTSHSIEDNLRTIQEQMELKPRKVFQPIRAAVTGKMVSPPLFETLELLGKEKTLKRLEQVLSFI